MTQDVEVGIFNSVVGHFGTTKNSSEFNDDLIFRNARRVLHAFNYLRDCLNLGRHEVYHDPSKELAAYTTSKADSVVLIYRSSSYSTITTVNILEHAGIIDYGAELVLNWIHRHGQNWKLKFFHVINYA